MNAIHRAQRAYSAANPSTRTSKSIEYEVMARITSRMRAAAERQNDGFGALVEALHENKRLWMAFVVDIAEPSNPLPPDLKARIFYLAEFTHHHSSQVLNRTATVEPLLDINTAVLAGLRNGAK